jgi:nucleotide-binding universal stress UspA family protein
MSALHILVPTDHSDAVDEVIQQLPILFPSSACTIHLLHVVQQSHYDAYYGGVYFNGTEFEAELVQKGKEMLAQKVQILRDQGLDVKAECVLGEIEQEVTAFLDQHPIDLIALPTHGRKGMPRFFLGSVTERIVRYATVPVLTFPIDRLGEENKSTTRNPQPIRKVKTVKEEWKEVMQDIKGLRDQLRHRSDLLSIKAKDQWASLETKFDTVKKRLGRAWDTLEDVSEDVWEANKHTIDELRQGYQKIKKDLQD